MAPTGPITLARVIEGREYHAQVSSRGFLSLTEAARVARVDYSTVWWWVKNGKLSSRGGARSVRVSELLRFLQRRTRGRGAQAKQGRG